MTTKEKVHQIVKSVLGIDIVEDNNNIVEDLYGDSLDIVDIVMQLEREFSIVIPYDIVESLHTVGDFVNYIESQKEFSKPDKPHSASRKAPTLKGPSENWY